MKWERTGKTVGSEGTTIEYRPIGANNIAIACRFSIESRKRHIPHANRSGTWDCTTYWVLYDGKDIIERYSLSDAKQSAEDLINDTAGT